MNATIPSFPTQRDLIAHILGYLPSNDLLNMRVNRTMDSIIRLCDQWEHIIYCKTPKKAETLLSKFNFTRYNLLFMSDLPQSVLKHVGKCKQISLPHNRNMITDQMLQYFSKCPSMDLKDCSNITGAGLKHLNKCDRLIVGMTEPIGKLTDADIAQLNCRFLYLSGCPLIKGHGLEELVGKCQELVLAQCNGITDLSHLGQFPIVRLIKYYGNMAAMLAALSTCQEVELSGCAWLSDDDLKHLSSCPKVSIIACPNITEQGLSHLAGCPNLFVSACGLDYRLFKRTQRKA